MTFCSKISQKTMFLGTLSTLLFATLFFFSFFYTPQLFFEYDATRDRQDILTLFENDRYWLTATPGYSAEYMLDTKSPSSQQAFYKGALKIYTVRLKGIFIGFCAYYLKRKDLGQILFIAVHPDFRNQGYARKMVRFCLEELKKQGVLHATMLTRSNNFPAQKAYEAVGFSELGRDEEFVYYFYDLTQ